MCCSNVIVTAFQFGLSWHLIHHIHQHKCLICVQGGTAPFECAPLGVQLQPNGSLTPTDELSQLMLEGGAHNKAAMEAFQGTDIVMTHSWNATVELYEYHRELADGRGHECGGCAGYRSL